MPVVLDVIANGPAARAGVRRGDVVTAIDGAPVRDLVALRERLASPSIADVAISLRRDPRRAFVVRLRSLV